MSRRSERADGLLGAPDRAPGVYHLAVLPDRQGGAMWRMLMDERGRRLRATGATKVNLLVERGNAGIADFYRNLGDASDDLLFMTELL